MLSIIISARKKDKPFWMSFDMLLDKNFSAIRAYGQRLKSDCSNPEMIITDTDGFDTIQSDNTIIIFKDMVDINIEPVKGHRAVAVLDSCNEKLIPLVASTGLPAVTCGLSARDTITLSSIGSESAVIDLQRSINCFNGSIAEPQEIPVYLGASVDSFALMAAASIYILSGKVDRLHKIHI